MWWCFAADHRDTILLDGTPKAVVLQQPWCGSGVSKVVSIVWKKARYRLIEVGHWANRSWARLFPTLLGEERICTVNKGIVNCTPLLLQRNFATTLVRALFTRRSSDQFNCFDCSGYQSYGLLHDINGTCIMICVWQIGDIGQRHPRIPSKFSPQIPVIAFNLRRNITFLQGHVKKLLLY